MYGRADGMPSFQLTVAVCIKRVIPSQYILSKQHSIREGGYLAACRVRCCFAVDVHRSYHSIRVSHTLSTSLLIALSLQRLLPARDDLHNRTITLQLFFRVPDGHKNSEHQPNRKNHITATQHRSKQLKSLNHAITLHLNLLPRSKSI
jgi:hypothetical protein